MKNVGTILGVTASVITVSSVLWHSKKAQAATPTPSPITPSKTPVTSVTVDEILAAKSLTELNQYYDDFTTAFFQGKISVEEYKADYEAYTYTWDTLLGNPAS